MDEKIMDENIIVIYFRNDVFQFFTDNLCFYTVFLIIEHVFKDENSNQNNDTCFDGSGWKNKKKNIYLVTNK